MKSVAPPRREYHRQWHLKNRERRLAASKERYQENKPMLIKQNMEWQRRNRNKTRAYHKLYRSKPGYKEFNRVRMAAYRQENARKLSAWRKARYLKEPEKFLSRSRLWLRAHPEVVNQNSAKRRAIKRAVTVNSAGIVEWMAKIKSKDFRTCYYCQRLFHSCDIHFDHIVPLIRGGAHALENLCVSCQRCNLSKGGKLMSEWWDKPEPIFDL